MAHFCVNDVLALIKYALAVAAKPFLGEWGFVLIGVAALFSTASAINATLFGTARLASVMAGEESLPSAFAFRRRGSDIPWFSLMTITVVTLLFVNLADLTMISSFASATFLLIFAAINLSAFRLRKAVGVHGLVAISGLLLSLLSWLALLVYLWRNQSAAIQGIGLAYVVLLVAELCFSQRRRFFRGD
ncbi:MAG: hypothetical protein ACE5ET_09485 [Gammaproteobacteria bacterium]